jgi:cytochrome b6-f complex iron-sulfur subunit
MANLRARLTRRSVLLGGMGAAAAVCVGCGPERSLTDDSSGAADGLVDLGELQPLLARMGDSGRVYLPEARGYLVAYPADKVVAAKDVYPASIHPSLDLGVLLLSQKCPHLGCRVPDCNSSGWFECPCHVSRFSGVGEYRDGVSARGMDLIPLVPHAGQRVAADVDHIEQGLAKDVDVTEQDASGDHCI